MRIVKVTHTETRYVLTRKEIEGFFLFVNPHLEGRDLKFEWQPQDPLDELPEDEILVAYFEITERTSD